MKKIISLCALALCATLIPLHAEAAERGKNKRSNQMEMLKMPSTDGKFVIDGHVDPNIPDSCYNIYITDIDKTLTENDLVACVPVTNKRFRFETDLSTMKRGRIRAVMPGGNLCSAWIEVYFIPDFTTDMTVHNGYYDIRNKTEYQFMTTAWLNRDAMLVLCGESTSSVDPGSQENAAFELKESLANYQYMLEELKGQIYDLLNSHTSPDIKDNNLRKLYDKMDQINNKMEALIDKYAATIQ